MARKAFDKIQAGLDDALAYAAGDAARATVHQVETAALRRNTGEKIGIENIASEKSSGNVFADLGLAEPEECLAKASLARKIAQILAKRHLTQAEAAKLLKLDQPKVSAIMNGRLSGFSLERLLLLLVSLDRDVEIRIKKKPRTREHASLVVKCA